MVESNINNYELKTGVVAGRNHIVDHINCQDSVDNGETEYNGEVIKYGFIGDGCGSSKTQGEISRSEVGANLTTQFLVNETEKLVHQGYDFRTEKFGKILFENLTEYLLFVSELMVDKKHYEKWLTFVINNLLSTALGIITNGKEVLILTVGDGLVKIDEKLFPISSPENYPSYIAYNFIDPSRLNDKVVIPVKCKSLLLKPEHWEDVIAVFTDGIFGYEHTMSAIVKAKTPQYKLNALSSAIAQEGAKSNNFEDDLAVVLLRKIKE